MKRITIIDYGASNLLNVVRALEHCGALVEVTNDADKIQHATRLVFPGVGAFGDCMQALRERHLIPAIRDYIHSQRPFLGICVGMQVMFEKGEEFGDHTGLSIIKGRVSRIPDEGADGRHHKIPHIGWNNLRPAQDWKDTIFEPLAHAADRSVYFVHSFHGAPIHAEDLLATVDYDGIAICAAVKHGNAYGCQFHPEKSGETGLSILDTFIKEPV